MFDVSRACLTAHCKVCNGRELQFIQANFYRPSTACGGSCLDATYHLPELNDLQTAVGAARYVPGSPPAGCVRIA